MNEPVLGRIANDPIDDPRDLDLWDLPPNVGEVSIAGGELTARCPVTTAPDLYDFVIRHGGGREVESRSLKLYLLSFRERRLSCAALAATIADDLSGVLGTDVEVELTQRTRGGMRLSATARGTLPG